MALVTAAPVLSEGLVLYPWPDPEAVGVRGDDLDVERRHPQLVGDELRVPRLVTVGLGSQAENHLPGRVDAQKDRPVGLVGHR